MTCKYAEEQELCKPEENCRICELEMQVYDMKQWLGAIIVEWVLPDEGGRDFHMNHRLAGIVSDFHSKGSDLYYDTATLVKDSHHDAKTVQAVKNWMKEYEHCGAGCKHDLSDWGINFRKMSSSN